jgi:hypothetical protein
MATVLSFFRKISDWFKYERLHHYPALKAFDRPDALRRLKVYEQQERKACQPWLNLVHVYILALSVLVLVMAYYNRFVALELPFIISVPGWVVQYVIYRRIRRRVKAKVEAELHGGRLWTCFECGYDLRSSTEQCPECGAPVRVAPPYVM